MNVNGPQVCAVERFLDRRYSRPRYRIRYAERQGWLTDGYTRGSWKFKRDAEANAAIARMKPA